MAWSVRERQGGAGGSRDTVSQPHTLPGVAAHRCGGVSEVGVSGRQLAAVVG